LFKGFDFIIVSDQVAVLFCGSFLGGELHTGNKYMYKDYDHEFLDIAALSFSTSTVPLYHGFQSSLVVHDLPVMS